MTSCVTQPTAINVSKEAEVQIKKVVCAWVCEISYSFTEDSVQTIKEIRVHNAVVRAKCSGQIRYCKDRVQ